MKTKTEAAQKSYTGLQAAIRNLDGAVAKQKAQVKANYPKALEAVKKGVPQVGDSEAVNKAKAFFDASKKDYQAKEKDLKAYLGELAKTGCVTEDLGHLNKKIQNQFTQVYNDLNDLGGEVDANTEGRLANKKKLGELGPKVRKNITNIGNNADNIGVNSDDIEGLKKKDLQHDAAIKKGTAARKALEEKVSKGHGVEVGIGPVYMKDAANAETGDNGSRYGVMAQVVKKFGHKAKTYLGGFLMVTGGSGSKTTDANKPSYQGTVTNESGNTSFTAGVVAGKDDLLHNGKNVDFGLEGALGGGVDLETKNTKVKGQHYVNGVKQGKALEYDKDSTTERPGNFVGMICPTVTFNNKLKLSTCAIGKLNTKGKVSPGGSLLLKYAF